MHLSIYSILYQGLFEKLGKMLADRLLNNQYKWYMMKIVGNVVIDRPNIFSGGFQNLTFVRTL